MLDVLHVYRFADGAKDWMIEARGFITCAEKALFIGIIFSSLLLCKHNIVNKRIVGTFRRKWCDEDNCLIRRKLVLPAARRKDWIRNFLIWRCRQIKYHVGGACIVTKTTKKFAFRSHLNGIKLVKTSLLDGKTVTLKNGFECFTVTTRRRNGCVRCVSGGTLY